MTSSVRHIDGRVRNKCGDTVGTYVRTVLHVHCTTGMSMVTRKKAINFRELVELRLPKPERTRPADPNALYDVEVLERDAAGGTAKIHYVGYSSRHEWRSVSELVDRTEEADEHE